jgi:dephospho-CoA kinase
MIKIGLTGGIGSGKSTVSELFSALGITVIDSDIISHQLTEPGSPLTQEIVAHFGEGVIQDGKLNRAALRRIIFENPEEKKWLETLLHPAIIHHMIEAAQKSKSPYCIFAIPLLIEGDFQHLVDRIVVVDAPVELQIARTEARDKKSEAEIRAIINAQSSRAEKLAAADDIIINEGSFDKLKQAVLQLHAKYLALQGS